MGCDIHIYIEYSRDSGKSWQADPGHVVDREDDGYAHVNSASAGRNYEMFGLMADVRGSGQLIPGRPLPSDLSEAVKIAWDGGVGDWHSPSWCSPTELEKCCKKLGFSKQEIDEAVPNAFGSWKMDQGYHPSYKNIVTHCKKKVNELKAEHVLLGDPDVPLCRLVFWFDN